jgi:hypothetical protein
VDHPQPLLRRTQQAQQRARVLELESAGLRRLLLVVDQPKPEGEGLLGGRERHDSALQG